MFYRKPFMVKPVVYDFWRTISLFISGGPENFFNFKAVLGEFFKAYEFSVGTDIYATG